jgi:hypothetical protein
MAVTRPTHMFGNDVILHARRRARIAHMADPGGPRIAGLRQHVTVGETGYLFVRTQDVIVPRREMVLVFAVTTVVPTCEPLRI